MRKSLNNIVKERISSPLYGNIIISWLFWNWKIIYLTFFVSEKMLDTDKITYISENFICTEYLIIYPLLSSIVLLTIIPFISNAAYWLNIKFDKWRIDQKNKVYEKGIDFKYVSKRLKEIDKNLIGFYKVLDCLQKGEAITEVYLEIPMKLIIFLEINDIIEEIQPGIHKLTKEGKYFAQKMI